MLSFPQSDVHSVALLEFMRISLFIVSEWALLSDEFLWVFSEEFEGMDQFIGLASVDVTTQKR